MTTATKTATKKGTDAEDVEAQVRVLKEDVATLTQLLKEIGETKTAEARDAAMARAQEVIDGSARAVHAARAHALETTQSIESRIAEKPLQSTMIALGIGVALGWLSRR